MYQILNVYLKRQRLQRMNVYKDIKVTILLYDYDSNR